MIQSFLSSKHNIFNRIATLEILSKFVSFSINIIKDFFINFIIGHYLLIYRVSIFINAIICKAFNFSFSIYFSKYLLHYYISYSISFKIFIFLSFAISYILKINKNILPILNSYSDLLNKSSRINNLFKFLI